MRIYVDIAGSKRLCGLLVLLALPFAAGCAAPAPTGPTPPLEEIRMVSATVGWGLADNGVYHTDDGGAHWKNVTPPEFDHRADGAQTLAAGYADAAHTAVVTSAPAADEDPAAGTSVVFRTGNGGRTWQQVSVGIGAMGAGLFSSDAEHVWLSATNAIGMGHCPLAMARSGDGGQSWEPVYRTSNGDTIRLGVCGNTEPVFEGADAGWIAAHPYAQGGFAWIYRTQDGGRSWNAQKLRMPDSQTDAQPTGIFAFGQTIMIPVVRRNFAADATTNDFSVYVSRDGGETWHATATITLPAKGYETVVFDFPDAHHGYAWGYGRLYFTRDGGVHWSSRRPDMEPGSVKEITFADDETGWLLGSTGLYRTSDGGKHWTRLAVWQR